MTATEGGTAADGGDESSSTGDSGDDTNGGSGQVGCSMHEDCEGMVELADCEAAICMTDGTCGSQQAELGAPCGDPEMTECSTPDTCNVDGECVTNHYIDGVQCTMCDVPPCECRGGECDDCLNVADLNQFNTGRAVLNWQMTGGWQLRRGTAHSRTNAPEDFDSQVLGTDGNRADPLPGNETETSYARTVPIPIPATLDFMSWHVDQGGAGGSGDNKTIRVSVDDGATWTTLVDCSQDGSWPFCMEVTVRDVDAWDTISVPVPAELQGQVGRVEFGYDSGDECCDFEQGWYLDDLSFAAECMCELDLDCADWGTECTDAVCNMTTNTCRLAQPAPAMVGSACGDQATDTDCNPADSCDNLGYCRDNLQPSVISYCSDCPGGGGLGGFCAYCSAGDCVDCEMSGQGGGLNSPASVAGWTSSASTGTNGWGLYDEAPLADSAAIPFPNAPVWGTDGNRSTPYPGGELEVSQSITTPFTVPNPITFLSWHVDEGSGSYDNKAIDISVDGGVTWTAVEDCQAASPQPFCDYVGSRAADAWDSITLNTAAWAGMTGQLRFRYNTGDSCCGFERGWFMDDYNFTVSCVDPIVWPGE